MAVAENGKLISVRLDASALKALQTIQKETPSRSEAVRRALIEAASKRSRRATLAAEASRLAKDAADRSEMAAIAEMMEELRAPR